MNQPRVPFWLRQGAWLSCWIILPLLYGCGSSGEGSVDRARANASGKAEFDGKPIPAGAVVFTHLDSGIVVSCPISSGKYANERNAAPLVGKNSISVIGMDKVDGKPLWNGTWSKPGEVSAPKFQEDFSIMPDQVKPFKESNKKDNANEEGALWKE